VFGGYGVLHFSAAFWTIAHVFFTGKNKRKLRDISLRSGFAASGWSTVMLGEDYAPII